MDDATKAKGKDKGKKVRRGALPKRRERRFIAHATANPWLVKILGSLGAAALGAGTMAYFYGKSFADDPRLAQLPAYLIAGGAIVMAITIWLGTSGEAPVRVGDPGIAIERGDVRRMPWWAVKQISFEQGALALVVSGKDEAGTPWTFRVAKNSHPEAIGWIVNEAEERIPKRVDIPEAALEKIPSADPHAGTVVNLEPLQVVGRKCAVSGRTISYEPDARVCTRCERVYDRHSVPKKCKCGAALDHLRTKHAREQDAEDDENEDEERDADERDDEDEDEERADAKAES